MAGVLDRLPDLSEAAQLAGNAQAGLSSLTGALESLEQGSADSPLAAVARAFEGLNGKLHIDVSGLSGRLPSTLNVLESAVPPAALDFVRSIGTAYGHARQFLAGTPFALQIKPGSTLQETALAVISEVLTVFHGRLGELGSHLIDPAALGTVKDSFDAVARFQADFNSNRGSFLPFLSSNLLGVSHDLLAGPLAHVNASMSVTAAFDTAAAQAALGPLRDSLAGAYLAVVEALEELDPADVASYERLQVRLQAFELATTALRDALGPFYRGVQTVVDSHAWDFIFSTLESLLSAITIPVPFSANDVINLLAEALNDLIVRFQALFGPDELIGRLQALNRNIRAAFNNSPLGLIRQTIREFLSGIRQAIEAVPTGQIQSTVDQMLGRLKQEVDNLNLAQIGDSIEAGLRDAQEFITNNINAALRDTVRQAVAVLLENLRNLPIADLGASVAGALAEVKALIEELEASLEASLNDLNNFLAQLESISFKPAGDLVVADINDVKSRLQAINPNALSDVEKIALKAALAILQSIDLEGKVTAELKSSVHGAGNGLRPLLNDLAAVLDRLRQQLGAYEPQKILGALPGLLDQAGQLAGKLTAQGLLAPLYRQVDDMSARLNEIAPGRLLDPLEQPYQAMISVVNKLDPAEWLAPLNDLYAQIDRLIGFVDITPVLEELDRRQRALFAGAHAAVLGALDGLSLPEPLASFLAALRPIVEQMTDALFGAPDEELKRIMLDMQTRVNLATLFEPLDKVFQQLVDMLRSVPADELTSAMNAIRQGVGVGLETLNPRNIIDGFRAAQGILAQLSPAVLFSLPAKLPALRISFQARVEAAPEGQQGAIAGTLARFDAAIDAVSMATPQTPASGLMASFLALQTSLRRRVNSLNASGAEAAYGTMRASLERVLPEFLRQPRPLTYADVLTGIETMRPSRQAGRLDDLVASFLRRLAPIQAAIQPAMDDFFLAIREIVSLINPLSVKDAVADIYEVIRQKVRVLDPARVAEEIHAAFDPAQAALGQLDPALLKARLDALFQAVVSALAADVKSILDEIAAAVDGQLKALRQLIRSLADQVKAAIADAARALKEILDKVEQLVFVEILARLRSLLSNLEQSFDKELDRVAGAFDQMLASIPLVGGASASTGV